MSKTIPDEYKSTHAFCAEIQSVENPTLLDCLLEDFKTTQRQAAIYLVNGICLRGHIKAYDELSILMVGDSNFQIIQKTAFSTLSPNVDSKHLLPSKQGY